MLSKILLLAASAVNAAKYISADEAIDGSYIVVFKQGVEAQRRATHMDSVRKMNATIKWEYNIGEEFVGYSTHGHSSKAVLNYILAHEDVDYVNEDNIMRALQFPCAGNTQTGLASGLYGLARTSLVGGDYSRYTYTNNGSNVDVYILDTGIMTSHN